MNCFGETQVAKEAVSTRHSKVAPASVSKESVKLAVVEATVPLGPESIVGSGGARVSTVHARETEDDVLPFASFARTSNVCAPWPRPVNCFGEMQVANEVASTRHSNVAPASVSENPNIAVVEATVPVGPESIVGTGGGVVSGSAAATALRRFSRPPDATFRPATGSTVVSRMLRT